jgi:hypothetical protein
MPSMEELMADPSLRDLFVDFCRSMMTLADCPHGHLQGEPIRRRSVARWCRGSVAIGCMGIIRHVKRSQIYIVRG